jgi:hypothetical protein
MQGLGVAKEQCRAASTTQQPRILKVLVDRSNNIHTAQSKEESKGYKNSKDTRVI